MKSTFNLALTRQIGVFITFILFNCYLRHSKPVKPTFSQYNIRETHQRVIGKSLLHWRLRFLSMIMTMMTFKIITAILLIENLECFINIAQTWHTFQYHNTFEKTKLVDDFFKKIIVGIQINLFNSNISPFRYLLF